MWHFHGVFQLMDFIKRIEKVTTHNNDEYHAKREQHEFFPRHLNRLWKKI
jgi:hypothetical protein